LICLLLKILFALGAVGNHMEFASCTGRYFVHSSVARELGKWRHALRGRSLGSASAHFLQSLKIKMQNLDQSMLKDVFWKI